jgi:hypothetical protein
MTKFFLLMAVVALLAGGCCGDKPSGSQEFTPGKGWTPTDK